LDVEGLVLDAYIARQPIFKKGLKLFAYELLFRGSSTAGDFLHADADQATSQVVMESFYSRGVDSITGGKPAFINFTSTLLLENVATLFPKDQLIVEILEDVEPTAEIIKACRELNSLGYTLAMDDFVYRPELDPLIELSKIIKFDFLLSAPRDIAEMLTTFNHKGKVLLAEKIETDEMYDFAADMGFSLFQGYFFSKPVTVATKALSPLKLSCISLLKEISSGDEYLDFNNMAEAIRTDVALSYKLLRLVNSAFFGLRKEVADIMRAMTILGTREIRKWVYMITLSGLGSDKPDEIVKMSMIRGRFLESLSKKCARNISDEAVFQTGLFSMLDVLMDMPMKSALEGMNLADEVLAALIDNSGPIYDLLDLVISLERSDWFKVESLTTKLNVNATVLSELYLEAVTWMNEIPF